jgi:hypothetical protein
LGRQIAAYESILGLFTPTLGRGVGGDTGHFTEGDRLATSAALAKTGTGVRGGLQDTRATAELQFRLIENILDRGLKRALGPNPPQGGGGTGGASGPSTPGGTGAAAPGGSTTTPPSGGTSTPKITNITPITPTTPKVIKIEPVPAGGAP